MWINEELSLQEKADVLTIAMSQAKSIPLGGNYSKLRRLRISHALN
jgi:hypothetical protein